MKGIRGPKRMIARLLVMAGVVAMLATGAVAANAAETPVATAQHAVSVSAVQPATRCANWCELKNHKAPWQCLDADTAHIHDNFDKVQLWSCSNGWNQQWRASTSADEFGGRLLYNRASGKCLDIDMSRRTSDGAVVWLYTCGGTETYHQHWKYYTTDGAYIGRFQNFDTFKCLDADAANLGNGGKVQQWSCSNGSNQSWELVDM